MIHCDYSDRLCLLITNNHIQAARNTPTVVQELEERMDRLGRRLASGVLPFRVFRLGSPNETLPSAVAVHLRSESGRALASCRPGALLTLVISGHATLGLDGKPNLLARDVFITMKQHGMLPLDWFHEALEEVDPAHVLIIYDIGFLDGGEVDAGEMLRRLGAPKVSCTQIWMESTGKAVPSTLNWLENALSGGLMVAEVGGVTVRSLLSSVDQAHWEGRSFGAAWATSLGAGEDHLIHSPVTLEPGAAAPGGKLPELGLFDTRSNAIPLGTMLPNRIRVSELVGSGGFGSVYLGEQVDLRRQVAIKVLHSSASAEPESVSLFLREMWSIARLRHYNIVTLYHSGTLQDGQLFYAMEYLPGETLRERLEQHGRLPVEKAVDLACQALAGLEHAHTQGVVHRDIKPENMMLVAGHHNRERLVVLDFGVARFKEDVAQIALGGTPGYMREGRGSHHNDEQADLFGVGVVLFEMLVGIRPGELVSKTAASALAELGVPQRVRNTVLKAIQPKAEDGFRSSAEFLEALQGSGRDLSDSIARVIRSRQPFRASSAFELEDAHLFFGRDQEVEQLLDRLLFSRAVVLLGQSGVGRTSLLRAGVGPRCEQSGMVAVQLDLNQALTEAIRRIQPGARSLRQAVRSAQFNHPKRMVLLFDHVESLFEGSRSRQSEEKLFEEQLEELLEDRALDVSVLLSVREDTFPLTAGLRRRLNFAAAQEFPLRPLGLTQAYHAFQQPLRMARILVQGELVSETQKDMVLACGELLPQVGQAQPRLFPPHLALVGQALYDMLEPGKNQLTAEHYAKLGRLHGILKRHIQHVIEKYVAPSEATSARRLLFDMVAVDGTRLLRPDSELRSVLQLHCSPPQVGFLISLFQGNRIIQPHSVSGQLHWQLAHDAYSQWVQEHLHSDEAEHKRLREIVLLKALTPADEPGMLNTDELNALDAHEGLLQELDNEISRMPPERRPKWRATDVLERSRRRRAVRKAALGAVVFGALLLGALGLQALLGVTAVHEEPPGRFYLRLVFFDGDWKTSDSTVASELEGIAMGFYDDIDGTQGEKRELSGQIRQVEGGDPRGLLYEVEMTPQKNVLLRIDGRNREGEAPCGPSWIPFERTPGADVVGNTNDREHPLEIRVPTCRAMKSRTVEVPSGVAYVAATEGFGAKLQPVAVKAFRIMREEVSRYEMLPWAIWASRHEEFALEGNWRLPPLPTMLEQLAPASAVSRDIARDYCRWWGLELPTRSQWTKAARGGKVLDGDETASRQNPIPTRVYPWGNTRPVRTGDDSPIAAAALLETGQGGEPWDVTIGQDGQSPYGVLNMAGNVAEWLLETRAAPPGVQWMPGATQGLLAGGHYLSEDAEDLAIDAMQWVNLPAAPVTAGIRCATPEGQ